MDSPFCRASVKHPLVCLALAVAVGSIVFGQPTYDKIVGAGETVNLSAEGTDYDCEKGTGDEVTDDVTIAWSDDSGRPTTESFPGGNTGTSVSWVAPDTGGEVEITATGSDSNTKYDDADASDTVTILVVLVVPELQIREHSRPANRIAFDDPRPGQGTNNIVIWHDGTYARFDVIPIDGIIGQYRVYSKYTDWYIQNGELATTTQIWGLFLEDYSSTTQGDFTVWWPESYACSLQVHVISEDEWQLAEGHFSATYIPVLHKLARILYSRFAGGWFYNTEYAEYKPTSHNLTATMSAEKRLTHKFGASLTDLFPEQVQSRLLPKADVTMPIYYWDSSKPTNGLIKDHLLFKNGVKAFLNGLNRSVIESAYSQASGPDPRKITIHFSDERPISFAFGPNWDDRDICLGHVTIKPGAEPYWGSGHINLNVVYENGIYTICDPPYIECTIEDVFDFNYFNPGLASWVGAPKDGASVQCSFGRPGILTGVGQVALVRIDVEGVMWDIGPIQK